MYPLRRRVALTSVAAAAPRVEPAAALADALARHRAGGGWHTIALAVPTGCDPLTFATPSAAFDAPHATALVGVGVARSVVADRHVLDLVQRTAADHYRTIRVLDTATAALGPADHAPWIGGLAFADAPTTDPRWGGFPTTAFSVPRWTFRRGPSGWNATLTVGPTTHSNADTENILQEWDALTRATPSASARRSVPADVATVPTDGTWPARIERALAAIAAGHIEKVVLARHLDLPRELVTDVPAILARLARRYPSCTRFLVTGGASEFFGASPETLVRQVGFEVESEALAGSCEIAGADRLSQSDKDQREHALVTAAIMATLRPHCRTVSCAAEPKLRRLSNIAHLVTPIHATRARPGHVLELLARLHPTPATAGTPTLAALALLRTLEPVERGWYAGPVGWFDAAGDGHFVVGLRSAVRSPEGVRVYAGSGIVRGSDPRAELDEMALKMLAMREVLGCDAAQPAS